VDPNKIIYFPSGSLLDDTLQIDKACFSHLYQVQAVKLQQKHGRYHKVRKGETLAKIAYTYGISVKRLAKLNKVSTRAKLKAGRRVRVR
jgi:hypothetical protein